MASLRGGRNRKFKADINVVPYIDVMLVLLVIFMVCAPMTNPSVINLPTAGQSTQPPPDYIQIALRSDAPAQIGIASKNQAHAEEMQTAAGQEQLLKKLKQYHEDRPDMSVLISADKDMKYDDVIQIIAEAKKLGINRVGLATK